MTSNYGSSLDSVILAISQFEAIQKPQDPWFESTELTIYSCAKSGDLLGLRTLLRDNPDLLNQRHSSTGQTPLHVSAAHNKADLVKCFLDWKGPGKVELEAKNKDGETPLHIAVKNGCNDVVRVLLAHGASIEAKADNGMTPLDFCVYHSYRLDNCATFKILLEYDAEFSVKDDEGMTLLDYLSQFSGSRKLSKSFEHRLEEMRMLKAIKEACSETKAKMEELENELSKIVGSHELKRQLRKWAKGMLLDERRKALGLKVGTRKSPHMAFLGNPGTGKTMVARILGKLLHMVGILPTDKVTEVQRTDLVGEYIGETGPKTRDKIKEAKGGILFVDEAYRLLPERQSRSMDYGLEALEEIMSFMDSGEIVVIFAGYCEQMQYVIDSNEGFHRRVTKVLYFNDFSSEELANILHIKMDNQTENSSLYGFKLHPTCTIEAISDLIERETQEKQRKEMNGGLIDPMLVNARENLDGRLSFDCIDTEKLQTITMDDLEAGVGLITQL